MRKRYRDKVLRRQLVPAAVEVDMIRAEAIAVDCPGSNRARQNDFRSGTRLTSGEIAG
jgi:hypothetical protein